jgi:general secretion pathway protein I
MRLPPRIHFSGRAMCLSWRAVAGFTLIEVLVAVAIAGIALASLTAAIRTGLGNAEAAEQYNEAAHRAQSRLDTVGIVMKLTPGEQSGDDGGGFSWRVRISAPQSHPMPPRATDPRPPALYDVEVTVSWRNRGAERSVIIHSQRLGAAVADNA